MKNESLRKKMIIILLFGILFLVYFYKMSYFYNIKIDDAFVFDKVSYNIVHYSKFSYNIVSTGAMPTSLIYPLINAPLLIIFNQDMFPTMVNILSSFYILIQVFIIYIFYNKTNKPDWFYLSLLLLGTNTYYVTLGMETTLQMLFLILYSYVFTMGKQKYNNYLLGMLISLSYLIRPDLLLVLIVSYVVLILSQKLNAIKHIIEITISMVGSYVFILVINKIITNTYLPSTLGTKLIQGKMNLFGTYISKLLANPLPILTNISIISYTLVFIACIGIIVLAYDIIKFNKKDAKFFMIVALYGMLHAIVYSIIGISYYHWYFTPFTIGVIFSLFYLVSSKAYIFTSYVQNIIDKKYTNIYNNLLIAFFIIVVLIISNILINTPVMPWNGDRGEMYKEVGIYLKDLNLTCPVFVGEVGIIGYYANGVDVLDYFGVIYPNMLTYDKTNWNNNIDLWIRKEKPEYIFIWYPPPSDFINTNYTIKKHFYDNSENWHYALYELKKK